MEGLGGHPGLGFHVPPKLKTQRQSHVLGFTQSKAHHCLKSTNFIGTRVRFPSPAPTSLLTNNIRYYTIILTLNDSKVRISPSIFAARPRFSIAANDGRICHLHSAPLGQMREINHLRRFKWEKPGR